MKKFVSVLCALLLTAGCTGAPQDAAQQSGSGEGGLVIYTSVYPMYDFTAKIAGEKASVTNLISAGTEPHDWEPSTAEIAKLESADMLIYSGMGIDPWVDKVAASLENSRLAAVEASQGITPLEQDGSSLDPHVWLSPKNAKIQMENIKNALVKADPENRGYYEGNFKIWGDKLDALDDRYRAQLSALPGKTIVVAHEAFGYLCAEYGLIQVGITGLSPESEPDPAQMAQVIRYIREHGVKTVFFEDLASPKVAQAAAAEAGVKTALLSPIEGLTPEQEKAGEDYFSIMESNLEALRQALA